MSVRDLRFYNEDSKQWENLLASNVDLLKVDTKVENHIKDIIPHLQPGERELIVNSLQRHQTRVDGTLIDTIITPGVYSIGDNTATPLTPWGTLLVYTSDDVVIQAYYDAHGIHYSRTSYADIGTGEKWIEWRTTATKKELIAVNASVTGIYTRYNPIGAKQILDWDSIVETGTYQGQATTLNAPPLSDWYLGEYIAHNQYYGVLTVKALRVNGLSFERRKSNDVWGEWYLVDDRPSEWIPIVTMNGWSSQLAMKKTSDGLLALRGYISSPTPTGLHVNLFQLPEEYRPTTFLYVWVNALGTQALDTNVRACFAPDGNVFLDSGTSQSHINFDGVILGID